MEKTSKKHVNKKMAIVLILCCALVLISLNYYMHCIKLRNTESSICENEVIAYRCLFEECEDLQEVASSACMPLPDDLIIEPGNYCVYGRGYTLDQDGLYRFIRPFEESEQRIVWGGADG